MSFIDWISKHWLATLLTIVGFSLLLSWLQGILQIQFYYILIITAFMFLGAYLSNKKTEQKLKLLEARDSSQPIIDEFKPVGKEIEGIYEVDEIGQLKIPKHGAYRIDYGGSPKTIVFVDAKTDKPFAYQGNLAGVKSPIETMDRKQLPTLWKLPKFREKIERKTEPS